MVGDPTLVSPYFRYLISSLTSAAALGSVVVPANPARVALILVTGSSSVAVQPIRYVPGVSGFQVLSTGLPLIIKFADVGGLVCQQWFLASAIFSDMYIVEVMYSPVTD